MAFPGPPCPRPRPHFGAPRAQREPGPCRGRRPCGYLLQQGPQEQLMAAAALRPLAHVGRRHQALAGAEVLRVHGWGATPGSPSAQRSGAGSPPPPPPAAPPAAARPAEPHAPPGCSAALPWWRPGSFRVLPKGGGLLRAAPRRRQPPSPLLDRGGCRRLPGPRGASPAGGRLVGRGELAGLCLLLPKSVAVENSHITPLG